MVVTLVRPLRTVVVVTTVAAPPPGAVALAAARAYASPRPPPPVLPAHTGRQCPYMDPKTLKTTCLTP